MAFSLTQIKEYYIDILCSNDKVTWEPILTKSASCGFSGGIHVFEFPLSQKEKEFSFIKVVGRCNSTDNWNCISELKILGYKNPDLESINPAVTIFPNPAKGSFTVRIDDPQMKPDYIKLIDLSGIVYTRLEVDPDMKNYPLELNLKKGIYIVELTSGKLTLFTQKVVVIY
jgi:hypothetical protein